MNRSLIYLLLYLIALLPIAAGLYYTANYYINEQGIALFYSAAQIAGVHSGLSLVLFAIILAVNSWHPTYTAFAFMGALVVRLIFVVIAAVPLATAASLYPYHEALFIIIPSFVMIALEAVFTIRKLAD